MLMASLTIIPQYLQKRHNLGYACIGLGQSLAIAVTPIIIHSLRAVTSYRSTCLYLLPILGPSAFVPFVFKPRLPSNSTNYSMQSFIHPLKRFITIPYVVNAYLWNSGLVAVIVLTYGYVHKVTESHSTATLTMTIFGISEAVGAILLAMIMLKFKLNHYILHIVCNLLCGIFAIILGAFPFPMVFYTMAGLLGILHSMIVANMGCVSKHLYPARDIEYAFAYQEAFGGIGSLIGTFTAGLIQAAYGQNYGFYYMGAQAISGGLLLIFASLLKRETWTAFRTQTETDDDASKEDESTVGNNNDGLSAEKENDSAVIES